ncbi:hypothetical protein BU23DRAFT_571030 [Bimuria novae-zelandiae CBS 107.79]|uniref:Rhodopsin domain-containing protein n=1 Tax=Bimuria novae-zelandiae CBS 107.79 TaxID=1447943 RepID=A0A6A5V9L0_9PLEO|nr:hypothetical protein BU23DRAFT_571030 [Bimuria novae-zelandiae CBS 107.79]
MAAPRDRIPPCAGSPTPFWKANVVLQVVCLTIAGTLVFLRSFVRLGFSQLPRQWGTEDWLVTAAFINTVLWFIWLYTIIYCPVVLFIKLGILLMYRRLLVQKKYSALWVVIYSVGGVCIAFYTAIALAKIWQCRPVSGAWRKDRPSHCINTPLLILISGIFNTTTDIVIILIPIHAIWSLELELRKKIGVCAVLTVGAIAPVVSGIGIGLLHKARISLDTTLVQAELAAFVIIEITIGIIYTCLPLLPPLFHGSRKTDISRQKTSEHPESLLGPSQEPGGISSRLPLAMNFKQTQPMMLAREELNMLDKRNKAAAAASGSHATDMLDFLAEAGRIDDCVEKRRTGPSIQAREEINMSHKKNRSLSSHGSGRNTDLLDFLAEVGRIDDALGKGKGVASHSSTVSGPSKW